MADISKAVDPLVARIYEQYERRAEQEKPRTYLGASQLGKECKRALWYSFRWARREKFDGRMLRLFDTGNKAEARFVDDLRSVGAKVYDVDPATGRQFAFHDAGGHVAGHMDGAGVGIPGGGAKWHVLEFKTHSTKSFALLKKQGVQKAKPEHYAQMMWYMGKSGMERALYLAVDKNTDELYSERIKFDPAEFARLQAKAESIVYAAEPPERISQDPNYYVCKFCPYREICFGHQVPDVTCRTCVYATPKPDGTWWCDKHQATIPVDVQRTGCPDYLPLPFLVTYAEPADSGEGWIEFQRKDNGKHFIVKAEGSAALPADLPLNQYIYSPKEIAAARDHRAICDDEAEKYRREFGARIVWSEE